MNSEQQRLANSEWKKWGPYLSDRQWGTVREDYSDQGNAWEHISHDMARSKAYRWGEEGIAGICDDRQLLCFALALWNKRDPLIKERYFGLTNTEGNHGEDVKELYYYLDSTPTHSYMKALYKYPQQEYPYARLVEENKRRTRSEPEFELIDTGIFDNDEYFDVFVEYAKASEDDILIKVTIHNRGSEEATLNLLPTIWFRNTWSWGYDDYKPQMVAANNGSILIAHRDLGTLTLHMAEGAEVLFCENETNLNRLYGLGSSPALCKDGINDYLVDGDIMAVNRWCGTKAAANYEMGLKPRTGRTFRFRLCANRKSDAFDDFDAVFETRLKEADEFYGEIQAGIESDDEKRVQRQAFAGMLWTKQFYYYDVEQWLEGDPGTAAPSATRKQGRNHDWRHLNNEDIVSMPDKWEFPWYAAWDLAFHCIPLSIVDPAFAKEQLLLLTKEWYMHPSGKLPAYEWNFDDVNPPVHGWAAWRVYKIDQKSSGGKGDIAFLESVFHKLLLNFTWWVNRKDIHGRNIFQGGFLGLDNIGVFDRSAEMPEEYIFEQADATSWMAMFSLNMMRIALELARHNAVYQDMATKFFEHFLYIAGAMANRPGEGGGLWDEVDQFFYDSLKGKQGGNTRLRVRSMVGLIPLFAVEVLDHELLEELPEFSDRLQWFLGHRPYLASLVSRWQDKSAGEKHLLSLLRGHRMKKILSRMLDESEFLSDHGIRSLSKHHKLHPFVMQLNGSKFSVEFNPGESTIGVFGGNSNWRGPIWMPMNYLIVESLQRFHYYYTDDFKVEFPTNSGRYLTLREIAGEISNRLSSLFLRDENGRRPLFGDNEKFQRDPHFKDHILFYEYFHGDTGMGAGASHQTGWTGLVAKLLQPRRHS